MYKLKKKLERYLRVNLLGPGPRLIKEEFTGPRSYKSCETLLYRTKPNCCRSCHIQTQRPSARKYSHVTDCVHNSSKDM